MGGGKCKYISRGACGRKTVEELAWTYSSPFNISALPDLTLALLGLSPRDDVDDAAGLLGVVTEAGQKQNVSLPLAGGRGLCGVVSETL